MDEDLKKSILKTGTSLVGIVCKDGVVMAGDRKATAGTIVLNKESQKVLQLNDYVVISWTGSVADTQLLKKLIRAELRLKQLRDKKRPTIKETANLVAMIAYKNIRQPSMIPFIAGTMIGGFNEDETVELYSIEPAGSVMLVNDFDANFSSGMPYILGLLERLYKKGLSTEEGIELAIDAIMASSERDTASGHGVDVFKITKNGIEHVAKRKVEKIYTEQE
ncbi:proteasome subunit beta [Candidatus Pacearchaeota archaeon]|nr:proteasome subunit beta [Candidatus Pacearchaeota archaeon]|tara:strand:+ start:179 stop:841 length:663 start_codon:yes stop_codon:yes gene_type:complete